MKKLLKLPLRIAISIQFQCVFVCFVPIFVIQVC